MSVDPRKFSLERPAPDITEDWEVLAAFGKELSPLFPRVNELGIRSVFRGWPTFVPDGQFIVGESSRVRGFVLAGGCNAHGVGGHRISLDSGIILALPGPRQGRTLRCSGRAGSGLVTCGKCCPGTSSQSARGGRLRTRLCRRTLQGLSSPEEIIMTAFVQRRAVPVILWSLVLAAAGLMFGGGCAEATKITDRQF